MVLCPFWTRLTFIWHLLLFSNKFAPCPGSTCLRSMKICRNVIKYCKSNYEWEFQWKNTFFPFSLRPFIAMACQESLFNFSKSLLSIILRRKRTTNSNFFVLIQFSFFSAQWNGSKKRYSTSGVNRLGLLNQSQSLLNSLLIPCNWLFCMLL